MRSILSAMVLLMSALSVKAGYVDEVMADSGDAERIADTSPINAEGFSEILEI